LPLAIFTFSLFDRGGVPPLFDLIFMQDYTLTKNGLAGQSTPRVNVITSGNSIVVLVLAGGEHGGCSSYSCPLHTNNIDHKGIQPKA